MAFYIAVWKQKSYNQIIMRMKSNPEKKGVSYGWRYQDNAWRRRGWSKILWAEEIIIFGLPWTFTKYTITPSMLTIDQGLLKTEENDCYMYKVQDVKLTTTLLERIFGLGTITCYTGDVTNAELKLIHIRKSKEVKNYLWKHQKRHVWNAAH